MSHPRETHYDTLGIRADARSADIQRAHDRLTAEFRKATTPPDARREARVRDAYAVLSDAALREAYDASLAQAEPAPDRRRATLVAGIVVVLLAGAVAYYILAPGSPPANAGRPAKEIHADVSRSIGRVQVVDPSGKAAITGFAFTVASGVMATTCDGIAPGAQVMVSIAPRSIPARVAMSDETLGLCKLAVDGAGSWPLAVKGVPPRVGEKVYAAGVDAAGEVVLIEGVVKRVSTEGKREYVDASVPAAPAIGGRPLLDVWGRVLAVATAAQPGGAVRHVLVPDVWTRELPREAPPEPAQTAAPPPAAAPAQSPPETATVPGTPAILSAPPERPGDLATKIRPPPKVPGDL
jgi:hypothetical protein